jgi:hypothetical protein
MPIEDKSADFYRITLLFFGRLVGEREDKCMKKWPVCIGNG